MLRRLLLVLVAFVVVVAGLAVAAVVSAPSLLTPRLEAALTRASGHATTIRGGVRLAWHGGPQLQVRDLRVANAPWGTRPDMLTVPRLTADLDVSALLGGAVRISAIRLRAPDMLLETDAAGHGNWQPAPTPTAIPVTSSSPAAGRAGRAIQLGTVAVEGGHVAFRDGRSGRIYQGTVQATAEAASDPIRIAADLKAEAAELHLAGTVDVAAPVQRSALALSGHLMIPEPVEVAAKLVPGQPGQTVTAEAHGAGLDASVAGVVDPATLHPVGPVTLDATLAAGSPLPGRLGVAAAAGPATLHVLLRQQGDAVTMRELAVMLPAGDVAGDLDLALTQPPSLHGSLSSRRIDLERLLASLAAPPPPPPPATVVAKPAAALAPGPAMPLQWLDRGNADLHLAIAELHDSHVTIRDLSGHLVIQDGRLVLDPLAGTGPGGRLQLAVRADGRATPPGFAVVLHAPALALQPFLTLAGLPGDVSGAAAIEADLHASGVTRPDLLQSLTGRASVSMGDGDIDLATLSDLLAAAHLPFDARGRAHLRCLVLRAEIARGVAQVDPLVIDATRLLVQGSGSVDLVQRTLSLRLRPLLRTGPGLEVPMRLSGPWSKPRIDVDRGDLAGAVAGLIGQAGGDACKAAGVSSTVALPPVKPLKPEELLRRLLR